jgi:hypothetical protein
MSDGHPLPDDELVSAYLDGEATADERAVVEGRADLMARVDQFRLLADQVGDEPLDNPTDDERDLAIAAALASAGEPDDSAHDQEAPPPPSDLDAARARRRSRPLVWLGAAAAVVLVLAVGGTVLRNRNNSAVVTGSAALSALPGEPSTSFQPTGGAVDDSPAAAGGDADAAATPAPLNEAQPAPAAAGGGGAQAPTPFGNLGTFDDTAGLGAAVRLRTSGNGQASGAAGQRTTTTAAAADQSAAAISRCDAPARAADPSLGPALADGSATVAGQPVQFIVYSGSAPTLVVVDSSCTVLSSGPL